MTDAIAARWAAAARATGACARAPVEEAVRALYRRAGLTGPRVVAWCASPLEGAVAAYLAAQESASVQRAISGPPLAALGAHRRALGADAARAAAALGEGLCLEMTRAVRREIANRPDPNGADRAYRRASWLQAATPPPWEVVWPAVVAGTQACALGHFEAHRAGLAELAGARDDALAEVTRGSGFWWAFADACVLTERPSVVSTDGEGHLHADGVPALEWSDGFGAYAHRGAGVPSEAIRDRNARAVAALLAERNTEIRRVLLARLGMPNLVRQGFAHLLDSGPAGRLYRIGMAGRDPLVVVAVACPSTGREYLLNVPPWMTRAHDAVAWTFGVPPDQYAPVRET